MANSGGVWGIDIGQCALKALRCTATADGTVVADAFDYIEYPKILNQPEAEPKAMIQEALAQFLSRNKVKGDKVAISVSGQSGLARFFKPPPVDAKKMPDLVKFEARQQIPFALEDVIWDWQMLGGTEVDGFTLDSEVGLFAMKRDAVFRALEPFDQAEIECDIVQLAPEAVYNYVGHDVIASTVDGDNYDSDNPPPSLAVLSMGTDTSDLVVTNGFRLWQRSIPIGGNQFTKQLSKELKLTFAKAEHLKRNARQAEDPKAIFQAMRGTFNDMVTEVQRSLQYFQSVDRKAKIKGIVLLGNAVKLPGLSQYLAKNLGLEIMNVDGFSKLTGAGVVSSPSFKDNMLSFGVCFGLCLQGLNKARLKTNLVPRELITERKIRAKKPWAIASFAGLLMACSFNFFFHYNAWSGAHPDKWNPGGGGVLAEVTKVQGESTDFNTKFTTKKTELERVQKMASELVGNSDRRILWLEHLRALSEALPKTDSPLFANGKIPDHKEFPVYNREEIHIDYFDMEYFPDLAEWWKNDEVKRLYAEERAIAEGNLPAATPPTAPMPMANPPMPMPAPMAVQSNPMVQPAAPNPAAPVIEGPKGEGFVIELRGHHFYNKDVATKGVVHVRNTLIKNLEDGEVELPVDFSSGDAKKATDKFTMKELGIAYPFIAVSDGIAPFLIDNPDYDGAPAEGVGAAGGNRERGRDPDKDILQKIPVDKYTFTLQYVWKPQELRLRMQEREKKRLAAQAAAANPATNPMPAPMPAITK